MEEEFLNEFSRARGGFDGEMQSETASSGSFFGGYSETFHGSDPEETSGFLMEPTAPASHLPLSSSTDWTQLLMCGSRVDENLQAMHQDHSSSRTHLFQESIMGIDQHGFIMDGLLNEEFPSQTSNRFVIEDLSSHFSTANETKAKGSATKRNDGGAPALKKPRVETPSPLPSFKVRREKLGDRITALQQLVSPFGKTDTASVLYEAIEYIKLLHDQVGVLSTPYLKLGSTMLHKPTVPDKSSKRSEGPKRDLQSRGLCLVPISSTFSIINDATPDFWAPAFGTSYKLER